MKKLIITLFIVVCATSAQAITINFGALTPYDGDFVSAPPLQAEFGEKIIIQTEPEGDYVYLSSIGTDLIFAGYVPDDNYPWKQYSVFESMLGTMKSRYYVLNPGMHNFPVKQLFRMYSDAITNVLERCAENGEVTTEDLEEVADMLDNIYLLGM